MDIKLVSKLHWLGHDCFRVDADKTIYIDPYELPAGAPKADLILITHEHYDHFSAKDVAKIMQPETVVVTIASVAKSLKGNVRVVKPGDRITVDGIEIEAVPAYNINKKFHPKSAGHVGFIITVDGERLYHAGDTDVIPEMANFRVDVALLPVSGTYVMTADEALEAARRINPRLAIPMHYASIVGDRSDAEHFVAHSPVKAMLLPREA